MELLESELDGLTRADLPEGVEVRVVTKRQGNWSYSEWGGTFRSENGTLRAITEDLFRRKHWSLPLSALNYADLLRRAIEVRAQANGDVILLQFDNQEEDDYLNLSYEVVVSGTNSLKEAYEHALSVQRAVTAVAAETNEKVGELIAQAAATITKMDHLSAEELIGNVERAPSTNAKGNALEELIVRLVKTVPGFEVNSRVRTETEEIDVWVVNGSPDPILSKESPLILFECKNWTGKVGKNELVIFQGKVKNRKDRCHLGFLVSWNGFAKTVTPELLRSSHERGLVVPIDGETLRAAVKNQDFLPRLKNAWAKAVAL